MMNYDCAVKGENISKKFKTFTLDIPDLRVPPGSPRQTHRRKWSGKDDTSQYAFRNKA